MLKSVLRRCIREPLANIAVLIFAAVLTIVLCHLQRSQEEELESFEETYLSIPVYFSVTDLDGSQVDSFKGIESWVVRMFFRGNNLEPDISRFVTDLKVRLENTAIKGKIMQEDLDDFNRYVVFLEQAERVDMAGISSLRVAEELTPDYSGELRWYEGYGEEILESEEFVCMVPEDYVGEEVVVSFLYSDISTGQKKPYVCTLKVVGRYIDHGNDTVYCPYFVMDRIYNITREEKRIRSVSATLVDNAFLDELKETAASWFAVPNPLGTPTEWGKFGYEYYPYALDINDRMLQELTATMENNIIVNRLSSALVFLMSALAGFLTGFLVIRARKREITLMRTIGCSSGRIYAEFALEQLACLCIGVLLGGSYAMWQSLWKIVLFAAINFAGLSTALIVFLNVNLLSVMKEDE